LGFLARRRWSFRLPSAKSVAAGTADANDWLGRLALCCGWRTAGATGLEIPRDVLRGATKHGDAMGPRGQEAQL
jgi:hypothetical protein